MNRFSSDVKERAKADKKPLVKMVTHQVFMKDENCPDNFKATKEISLERLTPVELLPSAVDFFWRLIDGKSNPEYVK